MKGEAIALVFLNVIIGSTTIAAASVAKDSEIEVRLQFFEYELEDYCAAKNNEEWKFFNGTNANLTKLLDVELKESEFYKKEMEVMQKHIGKNFDSEKLQRLIDIFSHPGASLLGNAEFKEYKDYSLKLFEMIGVMTIENDVKETTENKTGVLNYQELNKILFLEKNEERMKTLWAKWFEEVSKRNKKTKYDFVQQLSILDLEAEQNGEEELADYWLKMSDSTWVNYNKAKMLWADIVPLYSKLKHFMISLAFKNFGRNVLLPDKKLIPVHILGSLESYDWVTAAEKLGAFDHSKAYKELKESLTERGVEDLYKMADRLTPELGSLPQTFYEKSRFNETSPRCRDKLSDFCEKNHGFEVMVCSKDGKNLNLKDFLRIAQNTMRIKHLSLSSREEDENGFLLREGPRYSALYEAIEVSSAVNILRPDNLQKMGLLSNGTQYKQEILSLIVEALYVLPPLPYYLGGDFWRINALREIDSSVSENEIETTTVLAEISASSSTNNQTSGESSDSGKIYDVGNLTSDWWSFRSKYQGVGPPEEKPYEDYLQEPNIIWNRPYISKFLGVLLQFQIMERLASENETAQRFKLANLMRKGKSKPWQTLVEETFNLTDISVQPLLNYFKPLEEFLNRGIKFKDNTEIFSADEYNFLPLSYSSKSGGRKRGGGLSENSDALFLSLIVIAAVGVVGVIVTIGRRRYRKRQREAERKRRLADL